MRNSYKQKIRIREASSEHNFKGDMLHKSIHLFVRDVSRTQRYILLLKNSGKWKKSWVLGHKKNAFPRQMLHKWHLLCLLFSYLSNFYARKYVPVHLLRIDVRLQIAGNPLWKSKTNKAVRQRIMNDEKTGEIPELFERTIVTACISIKKEELAGLEGFALTENGRYANE